MLFLRLLGPEDVVEEEFVLVGRCESTELEVGSVQDRSVQLSDFGVDVRSHEGCPCLRHGRDQWVDEVSSTLAAEASGVPGRASLDPGTFDPSVGSARKRILRERARATSAAGTPPTRGVES